MWKCNNCKKEFESPKETLTTYENYYGVSMEFASKTPATFLECPFCNDEDIEEITDEEDEENG